jgi:hypothetical protein
MTDISLIRLHALRVGYLILGGGLIIVKWPTLLSQLAQARFLSCVKDDPVPPHIYYLGDSR